MKDTKLAIVVPAFNEEETLPKTIKTLENLLTEYIQRELISPQSYILFVNDGSKDKTWQLILAAHNNNPQIKGVKFSRNFGNQSAILAGYLKVRELGCDAVVTIDADLQQDERKIEEFITSFDEGFDVVLGVRSSYSNKFGLKSITSACFYNCINLLGVHLHKNHSEYRLLSKKALDIFTQYKEISIFTRGIIFELGLRTKYINYNIKNREFGQSKFNYKSLICLALNGIFSFSVRPLHIIASLGLILICIGLLLLLLSLSEICGIIPHAPELFESIIIFLFGMQLFSIGILGEYISQIMIEIKARPRYVIDEEVI